MSFISTQETNASHLTPSTSQNHHDHELSIPIITQNTNTGHLHFGDSIEHKNPKSIRLYLQNINGCKLNSNIEDWTQALQFLSHHSIAVASLTETRTAWTAYNYNQIKTHLNKTFQLNLLSTSHCTTQFKDTTSPGGTATLINGTLVSRKISDIRDQSGLGRWSGFSFHIPDNKELHILTAY
jgi:hypothetical protein